MNLFESKTLTGYYTDLTLRRQYNECDVNTHQRFYL